MPLADRSIQPTWLGRRKLTDEENNEESCHIAVSHNAVIGVLVQLASLVRHADDLFCDLAEECQAIFEKTESITCKVHNIERIVLQMDSTEVKIPVGTLEEFSHVKDHHVAKHGFDCNLFTPANRPYCIQAQHSMCDVTPVHALRGIDLYRKDGLSTSILFKLWPIALKDTVVKSENMNIPNTRGQFHPHLNNKKRYKQLKLRDRSDRAKTIDSIEGFFHDETASTSNDLKTTKMEGLSKSQPSMLVAVDTSGAGFERMASFRRSVTGGGDGTYHHSLDRKRRRRTVSGIGGDVIQEIEQFEKGRRILRQGPRKYSLDNLDGPDLDARDELMQQFLSEIDNQRAEREELEYAAEKDNKLFKKLMPCRRSKSLPRCVKLLSESFAKRESTRTPLYIKRRSQRISNPVDEMRLTREDTACNNTTVHNFGGSNASLVSSGRLSRSSTRSSILGNKIRSLMAGTVKTVKRRPKSLDFDSVGVIDEDDKKNKKKKTQGAAERSVSMSRIGAAAPAPEGNVARAASSESTIGPGSYYYFDSNTVPRAQQCKYDFPWDSLPKDWTTAVKLREITKRRKEERQSSSGNWSASGYSSSNRQSLDSDAKPGPPGMPSFLASQHSIGRDSGRDSPIEERDGLDTGYMGDAASMESISDTKSTSNTDSDDWIKSLAERAASRSDVTSTSADALANLSRLTKENIRNLDILVPGRSPRHRMHRMDLDEDGESSVYSLDQDGFYTSFHNDSGLRRSSNNLLEEDEDLMMPRIRECKSLQSMSSCFSTSDSGALFRTSNSTGKLASMSMVSPSPHSSSPQDPDTTLDGTQPGPENLDFEDCGVEYGDTGTIKAAKKNKTKKKIPPPPPPRSSSCLRSETSSATEKDSSSETVNIGDSSPTISEFSDQETVYARLKTKTRISAQAIPSLCSNVLSDDDDIISRDTTLSASRERLNAEASEIEAILHGGKLPGTLPRAKKTLSIKKEWDDFEYPANSWPRQKKSPGTQQQQGILKTPEKDKGKLPCQQKTLNFDPVVNLYDPLTPGGKQMPLSRLSSSDDSSSSPPTNFCISTFGSPALTTNKAGIKSNAHNGFQEAMDGLHPHHRTEVSSTWEKRLSSSTPIAATASRSLMPDQDNSHAISSSSGHPQSNDPYSSASSSSSFLENPSQDSFHGLTLDTKSLGELDKNSDLQGSTSTIALSDIDNGSLTHVSETYSNTSGSVLSLNWDSDNTPNVTPMPTPARQHKTYPTNKTISTSLSADLSSTPTNVDSLHNHKNDFKRSDVNDSPNSSSSSFPSPPPALQTTPMPPQSSPLATSPPLPPPPPSISASAPSSFPSQDQKTVTSFPYVPSHNRINDNNSSNRNHNNNIIINSKYKSYSESSSSDTNNFHYHNPNNSSHFTHDPDPKPSMPKSNSWSEHNENPNSNNSRPKKNGPTQSNSFQYNPSWSGGSTSKYQVRISHQNRNQSQQSANYPERRRSNPVAVEEYNASQWNDNRYNSPSDINPSGRRHSGNGGANVMSPTDSGFGSSPSVANPSTPTHSNSATPYNYHRASNRSSLPSSTPTTYNRQDSSSSHSKVPQIKQPLLNNESQKMSNSPSTYHRQSSSSHKPDSQVKPLAASHSNDSLSSHSSSSSSSKHLISQNSNSDYTRPILLRGSSNESLKSNSSAGRSDSYRCAQLSEYDDKTSLLSKKELLPFHAKQEQSQNLNHKSKYGTRSYSTSSANPPTVSSTQKGPRSLTKSLSTPAPSPAVNNPVPFSSLMSPASVLDPDTFNRADSYRCAMQNTENTEQNSYPGRNSSYRFATAEEDVVFNSRMDFYNNMWTGSSGGTRDVRRMGITDVDQLKSFDSNHDPANTKPDTRRQSLGRENDGQHSMTKPSAVQLRQAPRSNQKDIKMKQKTQSSSYIRFDPIFESREDVRASKESLRPPSITSIRTLTKTESNDALAAETAYLMNYKRTSKSPPRKRSSSQGRRSGDEKSGFLGTLKTTIKAIGGSKGDD